jgi:hypothetical protein
MKFKGVMEGLQSREHAGNLYFLRVVSTDKNVSLPLYWPVLTESSIVLPAQMISQISQIK